MSKYKMYFVNSVGGVDVKIVTAFDLVSAVQNNQYAGYGNLFKVEVYDSVNETEV
jgi:hypothetical protein